MKAMRILGVVILVVMLTGSVLATACTGEKDHGINITVGDGPTGIVFDGANIWVTNTGDNTVTKLRASDGSVVGTYMVGLSPNGIAYDGTNIWVTIEGFSTVIVLRASDGSLVAQYFVGSGPEGIAFDGANMWVANSGSGNLTKL